MAHRQKAILAAALLLGALIVLLAGVRASRGPTELAELADDEPGTEALAQIYGGASDTGALGSGDPSRRPQTWTLRVSEAGSSCPTGSPRSARGSRRRHLWASLSWMSWSTRAERLRSKGSTRVSTCLKRRTAVSGPRSRSGSLPAEHRFGWSCSPGERSRGSCSRVASPCPMRWCMSVGRGSSRSDARLRTHAVASSRGAPRRSLRDRHDARRRQRVWWNGECGRDHRGGHHSGRLARVSGGDDAAQRPRQADG